MRAGGPRTQGAALRSAEFLSLVIGGSGSLSRGPRGPLFVLLRQEEREKRVVHGKQFTFKMRLPG